MREDPKDLATPSQAVASAIPAHPVVQSLPEPGIQASEHPAAPSLLPARDSDESDSHTPGPLTAAMLRELAAIAATGEPTDQIEWHAANALSVCARDKVLSALLRRGLIERDQSGFVVTAAGSNAIAKATGSGS